MIRLFKKYFIPHLQNDHQPHLLRWEAALVILSLVLITEIYFLSVSFWLTPWVSFFASIVPDAAVGLTNEQRLASNLTSLNVSPALVMAAQLKANDMASKGYFAHVSPEGITPWHWLEVAGYQYRAAGENLAVNFIDSQDMTNAWMNSPTHRANILNNNFTEIGIATAKGIYDGKETVFVAQFFGRPASMVPASQEQKTSPSPIAAVSASPAAQLAVAPMPVVSQSLGTSLAASSSVGTLVSAVQGTSDDEIVPGLTESSSPQEMAIKQIVAPQNFLNRFLTTPHAISNYFYFVLLTILVLALVLKIFIKIKIQHPALIVNGALLLIVISTLILANQYIALASAQII